MLPDFPEVPRAKAGASLTRRPQPKPPPWHRLHDEPFRTQRLGLDVFSDRLNGNRFDSDLASTVEGKTVYIGLAS